MSDEQLLSLSAMAAGYKIEATVVGGVSKLFLVGSLFEWNPLTDDGDALRLVIDLGLHIKMYYDHVDVVIFNKAINPVSMQFELQRNGKHIATRRAIVRAAAEIGKKQNEMR